MISGYKSGQSLLGARMTFLRKSAAQLSKLPPIITREDKTLRDQSMTRRVWLMADGRTVQVQALKAGRWVEVLTYDGGPIDQA